ncbi:MAG: serine/threonine-protein kinase [Deltaproteobacteria bacterium]|nr:serine/threonine-protein kinase [Deltaproteobacteria bacterium]
MDLAPHTLLGSYELLEPLGSGAMGNVYRARDQKLDRYVAVKVLRPEFASDPERLRRFEGEARSASALNHPGIVHIYDVAESGQTPFIAMELVEGDTFRTKIAVGPLPIRRLLELACQTADALASAHQQGIIHRDLKPENLMESLDGYVKILDFGLAKLTSPDSDGAGPSSLSPTATQTGAIVGTAGYMSPEQARGQKADHRSDQFSLGLILYEMATGQRAFQGDTFAETLVAILRKEPDPLDRLNPLIPQGLQRLIERCLEKAPENRFDSTRELAQQLQMLREQQMALSGSASLSASEEPVVGALSSKRGTSMGRKMAITLCALITLVLALLWARSGARLGTPQSSPASPAETPPQLRQLISSQGPRDRVLAPDLSGDGKMIVYVAEKEGVSDLYVGRVAGGDHLRLTKDANQETGPRFSPNGEHVAFSRSLAEFGVPEISIIPTLGGAPRTVVREASMPSWSPDGTELTFIWIRENQPRALAAVGTDGSGLRILFETDSRYPFLYDPVWSPDGRWLAVCMSSGGVAGEIWLIPADGGQPRPLTASSAGVFEHHPRFSADGKTIVFSSNRTGATNLWRVAVAGGPPEAVTSGPGPDTEPSLADNGAIAFLNSTWRYSLRLFDLTHQESQFLVHHSSFLWAPTFSPDGRRLAYSRTESDGSWSIWSLETPHFDNSEPTRRAQEVLTAGRRLTFLPEGALYPQFTSAGDAVTFNTWSTPRRIFHLPLDGAPPVPLLAEDSPAGFGEISPDGRWLAFCRQVNGEERIFIADLEQGTEWPLLDTPSSLPRWSPNGEQIAFSTDRSWKRGISVVDANGQNQRRLTEEGGWPVWWPDGSKIAYLVAGRKDSQAIRTVPVMGGPWSALPGPTFGSTNHPFDISPDGRWIVASDSVPLSDEIWLLEPATP